MAAGSPSPPPTPPPPFRPYVPAVPEVCGPQIVGCFRGPVGQLGSARPHPRSGGRERSSVGWGESGRVGRLRTGMRATSGLQRWRHESSFPKTCLCLVKAKGRPPPHLQEPLQTVVAFHCFWMFPVTSKQISGFSELDLIRLPIRQTLQADVII